MEDSKNKGISVSFVFESVMAIFYMSFAYVLTFTEIFDNIVSKEYRLPLSLLLFVYGGFRIIRVIRKFIRLKENEKK